MDEPKRRGRPPGSKSSTNKPDRGGIGGAPEGNQNRAYEPGVRRVAFPSRVHPKAVAELQKRADQEKRSIGLLADEAIAAYLGISL